MKRYNLSIVKAVSIELAVFLLLFSVLYLAVLIR
jgi:hypothetical protein